MTQPTPPIEFSTRDYTEITPRLETSSRNLPESFVSLISKACSKVSTDPRDLVEAGRDWWPYSLHWALENQVPALAQVIASPANAREVADVLRACTEAQVPVTAFGGRSGVCGSSVPVFGGLGLDMGRMSGVVEIDPDSLVARVLPGTYGPDLEIALREQGFTLGHWPQSVAISTVGGWLACRGAGQYSTRYGKIDDMVVSLEVVLANGDIIRTGPGAPKSSNGPDLTGLFVGSEGTLGVITEGTFVVHPVPDVERRVAFSFDSFAQGLEVCRKILRRGATPCVIRLYDATETQRNFGLDNANLLIVLDEGDLEITEATMRVVESEALQSGGALQDVGLVGKWLEHRNDTSALQNLTKMGIVVDTIEIAARWSCLEKIRTRAIEKLSALEGILNASVHQSHSYPSGACLYFTFAGNAPEGTQDPTAWGDSFYKRAWEAVMEATTTHGGTISHHHGIGLVRSKYMAQELGQGGLDALRAIKSVLDPSGILNPGKLGMASCFGDLKDIPGV